jgi:hypothetical protein
MYQCPVCNRECSNRRSLSLHIKTHPLSILEAERAIVYCVYSKHDVDSAIERYKNREVCCYELEKSGLHISKYIRLLGIKRSSSEERSTHRYKTKYIQSIQEKYGDHIKNISQVPEIQAKKVQTITQNYNSYEAYLSANRVAMKVAFDEYAADDQRTSTTAQKIKETCLRKYGVNNPSQHADTAKKISTAAKARCNKMSLDERRKMTIAGRQAWASKGDWESNLERRVQHCLVDINEDFVKHVFLFGYNFDLIIRDKILIEVQ